MARKEARYCEACGKRFYVNDPRQRYCSNWCQKELPSHRQLLECPQCSGFFVPQYRGQNTCSNLCLERQAQSKYVRGRFVIFERDGFTCIYCGRSSFKDSAELHADHVVPKSKGGQDIAGNLATACSRCNLEKHNTELRCADIILDEIHTRNQAIFLPDSQVIKLDEVYKRAALERAATLLEEEATE